MPSHPDRVRRNYPHIERPQEAEPPPPPPKQERPKEDDRPPREYTRGKRGATEPRRQ